MRGRKEKQLPSQAQVEGVEITVSGKWMEPCALLLLLLLAAYLSRRLRQPSIDDVIGPTQSTADPTFQHHVPPLDLADGGTGP